MSKTRESARLLLDQLRDERSCRVVLVSHCLLNENTRYAGGATRPGVVAEVMEELIAAGYGIHQLPCPERLAWGGVLKRHSLRLYHSKGGPLYVVRGVLLRAFLWRTKVMYRRLARQVARDVADYQRAGIAVDGIVGIGASPSCGVTTTLDLRASLEVVAACTRWSSPNQYRERWAHSHGPQPRLARAKARRLGGRRIPAWCGAYRTRQSAASAVYFR